MNNKSLPQISFVSDWHFSVGHAKTESWVPTGYVFVPPLTAFGFLESLGTAKSEALKDKEKAT